VSVSGGLYIRILLFLCVFTPFAGAQSFRGEVVVVDTLPKEESQTYEITGGQVVVLQEPAHPHWIEALEISVKSAGQRAIPLGAFSLVVFTHVDVDEHPSPGIVSIAGRQRESVTLVGRQQSVRVPVRNRTTGAVANSSVPLYQGHLGVQVIPIMKGIPPDVANTLFTITITPQLSMRGGIEVFITGEAELVARADRELELRVNNHPVERNGITVMPPGIYRLTARLGDNLEIARNVAVEAATVTEVLLELESAWASLRFNLPELAEVFIDGEQIDTRQEATRSPGTYGLLIRVGEYTIRRQIQLGPRELHEVGLDMDILVRRD